MTNLSDTLAALSEPVAWLHTLHMEGGQTYERLSPFSDNAFGEPGIDYSEEYTVTSEPLYRTGQLVPVPSVERVARVLARQDGYDPDGTWEEFDRNAAATDMMWGGVPEDQIFRPHTRWQEYEAPATAVIAAIKEGNPQ